MGDHGEAAEAEQIGTAVRLGIEPLAEPPRRGADEQAADPPPPGGDDLLTQLLEHGLDRALHQLEDDVAGEAVADDDVRGALEQPAALDVAGEVEVALGEEPEKGNQLVLEAHGLLATSSLNFAGNTESRDLLAKAADVVVADGFTGNVALKALEGTIRTVIQGLREEITKTAFGKLGGLLIRPAARRLREGLDPETYGGAYLLGLRGLAVIAHGNSSRTAIANAIRLAARGAEHRVVERLSERLPQRVSV